jgi:surface polysaccharide O-acyltransferase-like enzyme
MEKNRNITLDFFKIILSILVITIHIQPLFAKDSLTGWFISNGIARIAVPFFFVIGGYYIKPKIENPHLIKKYILHLLLIYITLSLIMLDKYITDYQTLEIISCLFFGYRHLWYVSALIIGLVLFFLLKKFIKKDYILLIISVCLYTFAYFYEPYTTNMDTCRNGLFVGLPFITLGYYINNNNLLPKIKSSYLVSVIILCFIGLIIESYYSYTSVGTVIFHRGNIYLSLIILCPALLMVIMKHSYYRQNSDSLSYFSSMSAIIYFIHPIVIGKIILPHEYMIVKLPLIVLISVLYSIVIIYVNKRIKIFL